MNVNLYKMTEILCTFSLVNKYILLTEFEVHTVSYGPSFPPPLRFMAPFPPSIYVREAHVPLIDGEKTRIRNLQYGP